MRHARRFKYLFRNIHHKLAYHEYRKNRGRTGQDQPFTAKRLESESAIGVQIERGGKTTIVAFRKAGVTGKATLGSETFDAPVYLKN